MRRRLAIMMALVGLTLSTSDALGRGKSRPRKAPAPRLSPRIKAEIKAAWMRAEKLLKAEQHEACGKAFEAAARRYSYYLGSNAMLWNAAVCHVSAGLLGKAVSLYKEVARRWPRSKLAPRALWEIAGVFDSMAFFGKAATWYERYFRKYPKHEYAIDALQWAVRIRAIQGDAKKLNANMTFMEKQWGRTRPAVCARAHWWLVAHYARDPKQQKQFRKAVKRYLKRYARHGDVIDEMEANLLLGVDHWSRACPKPEHQGLCMRRFKVRVKGKKKKQTRVEYYARQARWVKAAQARFMRVLRLWDGGAVVHRVKPDTPSAEDQIWRARRLAANARFLQAEPELEAYLRNGPPTGLDFNPRYPARAKRSMRLFQTWLKRKIKAASGLTRRYMSILTGIQAIMDGKKRADPGWSIAAIARGGAVYLNFADSLVSTPIPKFLKSLEAQDAYAAHLEKYANPLFSRASSWFRFCLKTSASLGLHSRWTRICETEANRLEPDKIVLLTELRNQTPHRGVRVRSVGFLLK